MFIKNATMEKFEMLAKAAKLFKAYSKRDTLYLTSDGQAFFDEGLAKMNGSSLKDKEITTITRQEALLKIDIVEAAPEPEIAPEQETAPEPEVAPEPEAPAEPETPAGPEAIAEPEAAAPAVTEKEIAADEEAVAEAQSKLASDKAKAK